MSPFPPAQNPRLVKEYESLKSNNFDVKVLYGEKDQWASNFKPLANPDFILVGGEFGSPSYYATRLIHKLLKNILPLAFGYNRVSWLLYLKGRSIAADLYIGHNMASLPIVVKLAKLNNAKSGFDAEDFHRNELTNDQSKPEFIKPKALEDEFIEKTNYLTAASPLICKAYQALYSNLNFVVINNVFPNMQLIPKEKECVNDPNTLNLFWFSQTIGRDRGIEVVIDAIGLINSKKIKLTLLGFITSEDKSYFESLASENGLSIEQLVFISSVAPGNIPKIARQHDIGLALELNIPFNRNICLTNKIFTYIISGLAIIATETEAQKLFLDQYPYIGKCFPVGDKVKLAEILVSYLNDKESLIQAKTTSKETALTTLNWEQESEKFMRIINQTLNT